MSIPCSTTEKGPTENSAKTIVYKREPVDVLQHFHVEIKKILNMLIAVTRNLEDSDLDLCNILVGVGLEKLRAWPAEPTLREIEITMGDRKYMSSKNFDLFQVRHLHYGMCMYFQAMMLNKNKPQRVVNQRIQVIRRLFSNAEKAIITEKKRRSLKKCN